ncbi:MAG TPA: hypothetical protein VGK01_06450, partial [Candidatus Angelobacter sp.]
QLGNHLKARMKVTTYILHMASSSRALGLKQIEFTRDAQEAVVVMQSMAVSEHAYFSAWE